MDEPRRRVSRVVRVAVLAAVAVVISGCTGDLATPPTAAEPAALEPAPVMWPPADHPVLAGMEPYSVRDPASMSASMTSEPESATGWLALYGDPEAEDPFDRPWALAVAQTVNYDNSLGDALHGDRERLRWQLLPPDTEHDESPTYGVLTSDVDRATEDLVAAAETRANRGVRISLPPAALADTGERLTLLAQGAVDSAGLGQMVWAAPGVTSVQWGDGTRRFGVQSFAPDPALELLLRAATGGRTTGDAVVPVSTPADGLMALRHIDDALVLVQSVGYDEPGLDAVVASLRPTGAARVTALASEVYLKMPVGVGDGPPEEVASGDALGGRWWVLADITSSDSMLGPVDTCLMTTSFQFPDGRYSGGGSTGGGYCTELGQVGGWEVTGQGAAFVHGDLPTDVARIVVTMDDGTEHEPQLVGSRRQLFGLVVPGASRAVSARTYDAQGELIVDLLDPGLAERQMEQFARNWPASPGG
jgi:hypothetical protein